MADVCDDMQNNATYHRQATREVEAKQRDTERRALINKLHKMYYLSQANAATTQR